MSLFIDILFIVCALSTIVLSLLVVNSKHPVKCSIFLLASFIPLAIIYFLLHAEFMGIIQIIVYGGAILMLFTFVVMMIELAKEKYDIKKSVYFRLMAFSFVVILLALIILPYTNFIFDSSISNYPSNVKEGFGSAGNLGNLIFGVEANKNVFLISFEVVSLLIIGALAGVVYLTIRFSKKEQDN